MSDNVYTVLMGDDAPFLGMANEKYDQYLRRGQIVNVHYDLVENGQQNTYTFNTIDVSWIDGQPYTSTNIPISHSYVGTNGWGIQVKPEIGDFVIAAFLPGTKPEILRFLKRSEFLQSGQIDINENKQIVNEYGDPIKKDGEGSYIPFRNIVPGEISIKSKKESEMYLDDSGAFKVITRKQKPEQEQENNEFIPGRLVEISSGEQIINEGTGEIKKDFKGNNTNFQLLHHQNGFKQDLGSDGSFQIQNNGWNITCDIENKLTIKNNNGDILTIDNGKINFINSQGDSIEIADGKIKVGTNAMEPMVLGNTLTQFMTTIIGIFNGHTHMYSPGPGTPTPTAPPSSPMMLQDFLSKKVLVE
ncbi:MAG: hypothetical protein NC222_06455 [Staphylococcus sp.]|nr:hypothetical protein [Staphylococcus sp.]